MAGTSTKIVMFLLIMNAAAQGMIDAGIAEDWGVQPDPHADDQVAEIQNESRQINPKAGPLDNLFTLFATVGNTIRGIIDFLFAAPRMLSNLGVPSPLTDLATSGAYIWFARDVAYVFTGRDLAG